MLRRLILPALLACVAFASDVHATLVITMSEVGSNLVVSGSGTLDLTGSEYLFPSTANYLISPGLATVIAGDPTGLVDVYRPLTGPESIGGGTGVAFASSGSGDSFGFNSPGRLLYLPVGYVSGSTISGLSIYNNQSFRSIGLTVGNYIYVIPSDTIILQIGPSAVPEPGTIALAASAWPVGLFCWLKRRRKVAVA